MIVLKLFGITFAVMILVNTQTREQLAANFSRLIWFADQETIKRIVSLFMLLQIFLQVITKQLRYAFKQNGKVMEKIFQGIHQSFYQCEKVYLKEIQSIEKKGLEHHNNPPQPTINYVQWSIQVFSFMAILAIMGYQLWIYSL